MGEASELTAGGAMLDAGELIRIDFSDLSDDDKADASSAAASAEGQLEEILAQLRAISPNLKALQQYEELEGRIKHSDEIFAKSRTTSAEAKKALDEVASRRKELFLGAFKNAAKVIDGIYKELTRSTTFPMGGTAHLVLESSEEPYLHGVKFNTMPPAKRFREIEQLSGGERTVAALALLFALWSVKPAPLFVMDEIDAALDNVNVVRVADFIRKQAGSVQFITISLKDTFYDKSDGLVGVYRNVAAKSSASVTFDLRDIE